MLQGIKYVSSLAAAGYGQAARSYMLGLLAAGIPLTWTPMRQEGRPFTGRDAVDFQLDPIRNKPLDYGTVLLHLVPEYIPLWKERESGKRLVGYCVWETDKLPAHWPPLLNMLDRLLVPTQWNRQIFRAGGVTIPIDVIPHAIPAPEPACSLSFPLAADTFVFYTIESWTARKAVWNTVRTYLHTFAAQEKVLLVVKTSRRDFTRGRWHSLLRTTRSAIKETIGRYRNPAPLRLINHEIRAGEIAAIHHRGDCYVSLCHSEGWGLGAFQAAAAGNAVIMTGYGGQLDYLSADSAYLIDYTLVPVQDRRGWPSYHPEQHWAEPDLRAAEKQMRYVFEHRQEARQRGRRLADHVRSTYGQRQIAERMIRVLDEGQP